MCKRIFKFELQLSSYWQSIKFSRYCPKFYIFTNIVIFQVYCNFLDQLLHPYKFYGRDMSGKLFFFIFASCEPLSIAIEKKNVFISIVKLIRMLWVLRTNHLPCPKLCHALRFVECNDIHIYVTFTQHSLFIADSELVLLFLLLVRLMLFCETTGSLLLCVR